MRAFLPLLASCISLLLLSCDDTPESRFAGEYEEMPGAIYSAFGRSLALSVNAGHCRSFEDAVDIEAMLTTAFGTPDGLAPEEIETIMEIAPAGMAIGDSICAWASGGGSYQAIMLHVVDGRPAVLFRLITADGGLTYHDVILGGTRETGPRIVDVFLYSTGEFVTESMARMISGTDRSLGLRLVGRIHGLRARISPVRRALDTMRMLVADGKSERALRYYAELPEKIRHDRLLLIERLGIARGVGDRETMAAVAEMRRLHPDDVSLNLHLFDHYFVRGELDTTLVTIDRLDRAVDGDPYLAYLRASIYRLKKDTVNMRRWAETAIQGDRSLTYPYWMLLDLSLLRREYVTTAKLLRWLERFAYYHVDSLNVEKDPRYAGFRSSKEHDAWRKWQAGWRKRMQEQYGGPPRPQTPPAPEEDEEESAAPGA